MYFIYIVACIGSVIERIQLMDLPGSSHTIFTLLLSIMCYYIITLIISVRFFQPNYH